MNLEKQKENFKNHRAIFKDLGNIKILDFKKPNSTEYRIRFLFEEDYCSNGYDKFSEIDGDICDIISDFAKGGIGIHIIGRNYSCRW